MRIFHPPRAKRRKKRRANARLSDSTSIENRRKLLEFVEKKLKFIDLNIKVQALGLLVSVS